MTVRADFINAASAALRPLVVAAGVIAAAATLPAVAHADPSSDPLSSALNGVGVANNGSASNALAGVGKSICPALVKPGATLASVASQLSGSSGLSPGIAGMVASMAIQMECPGFMTSLANGQMPQMPFPMQMPGAQPFTSNFFPLAGPNPGAPNPLTFPGH